MNVREKLEVIAHLGNHISYKDDIGICYDSELAKVIEDAYMTLKNGVTVQEWISVKEQEEPTENGTYLCHGYWFGSRRKQTETEEFFGEWNIANNFILTHWMPLPQPPKGE